MEEIQYHHHHHHHHHQQGQNSGDENQGQLNATTFEVADTPVVTEYQQQNPVETVNIQRNQTLGGVQTTNSFDSLSSGDSSAEMAKYFPDAQTPGLSPYRHQQEVEGQVQSTATSNTVVTTNIDTVNAGPYIPVSAQSAVQQLSQPVSAPPPMAQQQQQRPVRPSGQPQNLSGIPSYSSQIEGLSVSQAAVNDVLVDLQSKVINETLQQYQYESSSEPFLEPLPPIYIRAPQPTILLRSDLHRLRAELNSRVRPPVVYRHPTGANQFQPNRFQVPRFPAPQQQYIPPEYYGQYGNPAYATSDEYKTTTTTMDDEQRKEREERLYNQAESSMLNDDNINYNTQTTFDSQGLSTTSFDRHASPYQTLSFLPNFEDHQQDNEKTTVISSQHINDDEVRRTDNMFSTPGRPRQEVTFDINNCIYRCFEAHRQRVARRRAARQTRRARRHKQSEQQQQQNQQLYNIDQYQNLPTRLTYPSFDTIEQQTQWEQQQQQQPSSSTHYSDIIPGLTDTPTSVHGFEGPYIPVGTYDYTNVPQTASLLPDIQQYQSSDIVNTHTSQIPFSSLSTSNIDATVPIDAQSSGANYYQYNTIDAQEPYVTSNTFDYTSHQTVPSTIDFTQQPSSEQQQQQQQNSFDYSNQLAYSSYSPTDAIVPSEIQNLTSEYYQQQQQQQQIPTTSTFDYTPESAQTQIQNYDYQNIEQQSYQYPYNVENIQTEQKQTFDYSNQAVNSSDYYQQQPINVPVSQTQGTYSQPTGTFEYTRESYQSQEPIYDYQDVNQQSNQYSYSVGDIQQIPQQDSYNYANAATVTNTYASNQFDTNLAGQTQTLDYANQGLISSDYYQQQPISRSTDQIPENYTESSGTFDYTASNTQTQIPNVDYQNIEQQSYQYPYNIGNIEQQSFDYTSGTTTTGYVPPETNIQQTEQNQTYDYASHAFDSSNYYEQPSIPSSISQVQGTYGQPTGTFEYTRESYQSQEPIHNYQGVDQQSTPYSYNVEGIQQQQPQLQPHDLYNYASEAATAYSTSEIDVQQPQQTLSSTDYYQQQPISQTDHSQLFNQRLTGGSIPTGTVEYTRQAYYSQEPLSDNYTTETFIQQQEEIQSLNINDYLNRFESESSSPSTRGRLQSSDDRYSIKTVTTTPFIIQQNANTQSSQGVTQTYDLQNYTNESIVSETSQPPFSSSIYEEGHQHFLQQPEQHSEHDVSLNDTYNSLPPPPPATEEVDHQQESIVTNVSEFPPPPTPDRHTYQMKQQRTGRLHTSIIPSTDQPSIYTEHQPLQPISHELSDDHGTDDDIKEDEEIFDLHQCIAKCYAKYQDSWNKEEQRKYEERVRDIQQPIFDSNSQQIINNNLRPDSSTGVVHYIDGWTQTPSLDIITQGDIVQHKYDETPSSFDTKPYIPHLSTRNLSIDSRGQQTIEYSPPLITQTRHIIPTIPSSIPLSSYEYIQHEQQQQQPIYDHTLPIPPHLSFNDTDYQPNLYFSSQITAQPRQYQNIPFNTDEQQQQQQRYRAYSEPASIQQDSITAIPPIQPSSSQIFEDQTRRSISIPMIHRQQTQAHIPPVHLLENGRSYETEAVFQRRVPRIDPKTGLCLVPCPQAQKYAHLPPHLRPELFCIELPPPSTLPPVPPPPPPPPPVQQRERWCVKCCCVPGQSLVKKVVYRQVEDEQQQHQEESQYDYASVIDQMATKITVRYGNSIMEEGDAFVSGNYNERLRVVDFPVYVSGKNDPNLTPLVPAN